MNAPVRFMERADAFLWEVLSDTMAPTYRRLLNSVVCVPVSRYVGEGVYLVDNSELYRCQKEGKFILLMRDNPAYPDQLVHMDTFASAALAMVVADITIRNTLLLKAA